MKRFAAGVVIFAVVLWVWMVPWMLGRMVPPEYFTTDVTLLVSDSVVGMPPIVTLDRVILREFEAEFSSQIREERETRSLVCHGQTGPIKSVVGSQPPKPMTLTKWMGQACNLPPGRYVNITDVTIPWWLGSKIRFQLTSNIFSIVAVKGH